MIKTITVLFFVMLILQSCSSVKEYEKIVWPEENKEKLAELLKKKGIYEKLSVISYPKLNAEINEGNVPKPIENLSKK